MTKRTHMSSIPVWLDGSVSSADTSPANSAKAVTPSADSNLPDGICRALWVGGAGSVVLIAANDTDAVTIAGVEAGTILPIRTKAVRNTSTATNIVALY